METPENLKVLETLIEGLQVLKEGLPPLNIKTEEETTMYLSGINNAIFLANQLLENNGEFLNFFAKKINK
jgi:hypothetical protein